MTVLQNIFPFAIFNRIMQYYNMAVCDSDEMGFAICWSCANHSLVSFTLENGLPAVCCLDVNRSWSGNEEIIILR